MRIGTSLFAALLLAALSTPLAAQLPGTPRMLGTGGAYHAIARGHEAVYANPANLALPGNPTWSVGLFQIGVGGAVTGPSFADFADHFLLDEDGGDDEARNREFLRRIPASGLAFDADVHVPGLTVQVGPVAVGILSNAAIRQNFDRDLLDLFLIGYEEGRTDYSVANTRGALVGHLELAASYAQRLGPAAVGVTGRYLNGRRLSRTRFLDPRYGVSNEPIELGVVEVFSPSGHGLALDVGAAMQPLPGVTVSGAISNFLGVMRWSDDLRVREAVLGEDDLEGDPFDQFTASERALVRGNESAAIEQLAEVLTNGARPPTTLRLAAAYAPAEGTRLGATLQRNLRSGLMAGDWNQSLSVGAEQRLWIFGLRAGAGSDLSGAYRLSGGLSIGPLDLAAAYQGGSDGDAARNGMMVGLGLSIRGRTAP